LNQQIVGAISGQRTNFGSFGAGIFRSVAGTALEKGEGSLLGAFGGGKLGASSGNALWVRSADKVSSGLTSAVSGVGKGGSFGGLLKSMLHGFAGGGYMDGPSIVGENGPEILDAKGYVTPNNKLSMLGGGGHTYNINVDASGSTDPAQTRVQVMRGIQAAAPQIVASSLHASAERNKRKPPTQRK
jgi:hypothetical protein